MARPRSPFSVSGGGASRSALAGGGRRPLHAAHRVVGHRVLFAEIVIERGQRRELAAHGGAGELSGFERAAPGKGSPGSESAKFQSSSWNV